MTAVNVLLVLVLAASSSTVGEALLAQARAARGASHLAEAVKAYDALLAQAPEHESALLERAQVLAWLGRYEDALRDYRRARELPGRALEADLGVARVHAWASRIDEALAALEPWAARGQRQAVLDDATYRSWRGDLEPAAGRLARWLAAHPDDRDARLLRAKILSWQSRWEAARTEYRAVLGAHPDDPEAILGLARLDLWSGDLAAARGRLAALREEDRAGADARVLRAQVSSSEGRPGEARRILRPLLAAGSVQRDARAVTEELVAAQGLWADVHGAYTETNEGLEGITSGITVRVPALDGRIDVDASRSEVTMSGAGHVVTSLALGLAHPIASWGSADAGAARADDYGGEAAWTFRGGVSVRPTPGVTLRIEAGQELLAVTPSAIDRRSRLTSMDGSATWALGKTTLSASVGRAGVRGGTSAFPCRATPLVESCSSTRESLFAAAERRFPWSHGDVRAGLLARGLGYSASPELGERAPFGFFSPRSYRYAGGVLATTFRRLRPLEIDADARVGRQWVNHDAPQTAWSYGLSLAWRPGRWPVRLVAAFADSRAGLPVAAVGDPAAYREYTVRLGIRMSDGGARVLF